MLGLGSREPPTETVVVTARFSSVALLIPLAPIPYKERVYPIVRESAYFRYSDHKLGQREDCYPYTTMVRVLVRNIKQVRSVSC